MFSVNVMGDWQFSVEESLQCIVFYNVANCLFWSLIGSASELQTDQHLCLIYFSTLYVDKEIRESAERPILVGTDFCRFSIKVKSSFKINYYYYFF